MGMAQVGREHMLGDGLVLVLAAFAYPAHAVKGLSPSSACRNEERLATLVRRLEHADDPVSRARLGVEIRDLAEEMVASSIRDANEQGITWRSMGADLGVPFQTLYRRYGEGS